MNRSSNISITVGGCNITRNTSHSGWGGNVQLSLISEQTHPNVNVTFEDTNITYGISNYSSLSYGGGMYIFSIILRQVSPPVVNITGCTFYRNKADFGGALYMYDTPPLIHVYNTTLTANVFGGAVFLERIGMYFHNIDYYN